MSRLSPPRPSLITLAEELHQIAGLSGERFLFGVERTDADDLRVHAFAVPPAFGHPTEPLIGLRVPDGWEAFGLTTSGRLHAADDLDDPTIDDRVALTTIAGRDGSFASVIAARDEAPQVLDDVPEGWVPDALARCLGRATPPPDVSIASYIDTLWLDALAGEVLREPDRSWSWRRLAAEHPLVPTGELPSPAQLATRIREFALAHPWSWVRQARAPRPADPTVPVPPPQLGCQIAEAEWFDDGSMCRYLLRDLAPSRLVLLDLLAVVAPDVGDCLITALADTDAPPTQAARGF